MKKICSVKGCGSNFEVHKRNGLLYCCRHYNQIKRHNHIISIKKLRISLKNIKCCVCKNNAYARIKNKSYCFKHYVMFRRYGYILKFTRFSPNELIIKKNYCEVILRDNNCNIVGKSKIDLYDIENIKKYKWYNSEGYAKTTIKYKNKKYIRKMNKLILNNFLINKIFCIKKNNYVIDHINRKPLDNRRNNLRFCSKSLNSFNKKLRKDNKTGYTGIAKIKNKWFSHIRINNKTINLGIFKNIKDAIKVRREAELKYFGENV
jgi:hypothetical protein